MTVLWWALPTVLLVLGLGGWCYMPHWVTFYRVPCATRTQLRNDKVSKEGGVGFDYPF